MKIIFIWTGQQYEEIGFNSLTLFQNISIKIEETSFAISEGIMRSIIPYVKRKKQ